MKIPRVTDCIFLWYSKEAKHRLEKNSCQVSLRPSVTQCLSVHMTGSPSTLLLSTLAPLELFFSLGGKYIIDQQLLIQNTTSRIIFSQLKKKNQVVCFFSSRFKVIISLMLLLICGLSLLHSSAFFWLVSLLLSSVFWYLVRVITDNRDGPIQKYLLIFGVLLSVCIQELFRLAYYRLLK